MEGDTTQNEGKIKSFALIMKIWHYCALQSPRLPESQSGFLAGDSRAVLCRAGQAIPLTDDHKAAREDETVCHQITS